VTTLSITDIGQKIAEWAVSMICDHPGIIGWGLGIFAVATLINTGIKGTWEYTEMPKWARFTLAFTMPLALNFWFIGKKIGIQEPPPATDPKP
jgi:hypothetical protein